MAKVVLGVILTLAGISLFIASVWLLVDTEHPKIRGLHWHRGYSPKIGVAASGLLVIGGILCCCVNKTNVRRSLILIFVFLALGLTVSCFGLAVKRRVDLDDYSKAARLGAHFDDRFDVRGGLKKLQDPSELFYKLKTQLVVLATISGLDILVEITALITAYQWKDYYP